MDERQNGPDTGIAQIEAAPCHRAQKQGNKFRLRSQLTDADMGADRASQNASHQDRAEDGGMMSSTLLTLIVIPAIYAVVKSVAMQSPHLVPSLQQT
jgi:hypothetical protein